jgi:hypothetical protein
MENNITNREFWVQPYGDVHLSCDEHNAISKLLKNYLPYNCKGTCIEIDSYPGNYLPIVGKLGYELNGIDFHPLNVTAIPEWLTNEGFKVGVFI